MRRISLLLLMLLLIVSCAANHKCGTKKSCLKKGVGATCLPKADCEGISYPGKKFCKKHKKCVCCVPPIDCPLGTLWPCSGLNGTCIAADAKCNGIEISGDVFCHWQAIIPRSCKCCIPKTTCDQSTLAPTTCPDVTSTPCPIITAPTTFAPTTIKTTTVTPTTIAPTTIKTTTVAPTTIAPTTIKTTTVAPTTIAPTTIKTTTVAPTTIAPTTIKTTTVAPTTIAPTTIKTTTVAPTTIAPSTIKTTTVAPTTIAPTTIKTTTVAPTTMIPTTIKTTNVAPTTIAPTTIKTTTTAPTTIKSCDTSGMITIGSEQFKVFINEKVKWEEAKQLCTDEGMVMAEPQDPPTVAQYLMDTYRYLFWLGARGNGVNIVLNSGGTLASSSPYWASGHATGSGSPGTYLIECLVSYTGSEPYRTLPCNWSVRVICQCPSA